MDNISLALMIYVLVFYHEIRDLPSKAGYYFYAAVTAVMLSLAAIYAAHYHDFISWNLQIRPDNAEYNIALYLGFAAWLLVSMFYMKRKRMIEKYVESGYILTPQLMTKLMNTLHLRSVLNAVWMVLVSMVVMVRIIPELDSIAWTVFFGTVVFFVCFYVLYRLKCKFIDKESPLNNISEKELKELASKEVLTEEEQVKMKVGFKGASLF